MVKKIVKLILNDSIYPTNDQIRQATEDYFSREQPDFIKKFKKDRWIAYYETTIYPSVSSRNILQYC